LPLAVNPLRRVRDHLWYYNQIWYKDAPLSRISPYKISKELENAFVFNKNFHTLTKRRKIKKTQETKPIFEGLYLGIARCDLVEI